MRLPLVPHPETPCPLVSSIEVEVQRQPGGALSLRYRLSGQLDQLIIPPPEPRERGHRLWEHCCFELFVRDPEGEGYREYNFAPSGRWAAYRLSGYRAGMRETEVPAPPLIETRSSVDRLEVEVGLVTGLPDAPWHVGLSAIVEDRSGERHFWALAHPDGEPDFHSPDCFALELAPPA